MTPLVEDVGKLKLILQKLTGISRRMALSDYAAPVKKTNLDRTIVVVDLLLVAWMAIGVFQGFREDSSNFWLTLAVLPFTLFIADLAGQVFHKVLDSYASETHPLWGKAAREFRKHHEYPDNLNEVDYLSHVSAFGRLLSPVFIGMAFVNWANAPEIGFHVVFLLVVLLNATEIHKQAHKRDANWFVRPLQKSGIILDYRRHMKHHRPPYDNNYSVINGWSQVILHKTGFWPKMDYLWWKTFGELPRIWIHDPRAIPAHVIRELHQNPERVPNDLVVYMQVYGERATTEVAELLTRTDTPL